MVYAPEPNRSLELVATAQKTKRCEAAVYIIPGKNRQQRGYQAQAVRLMTHKQASKPSMVSLLWLKLHPVQISYHADDCAGIGRYVYRRLYKQ